MPLPELTTDKKFLARDIQFRVLQIQEGIRGLQQRIQNESTHLRQLIEGWTLDAGLTFDKVTFNLDDLKWTELPPPPAPPAPVDPGPGTSAVPAATEPVAAAAPTPTVPVPVTTSEPSA